jgi:hypothetical protein
MYLAGIWGRYAGQTDTRLQRDVAALSDPHPTERLVEGIIADRGRVELEAKDLEGKGATSGLYRFAYVLARSRGAKDWFSGQTLYQKAVGKSNGLHSHHVFPRAVLTRMGVTERALVNQVANRAFLTQKANLKISSQEPCKYLPDVEARFPGALRQQNVPMEERLWEKEAFEAFTDRRRKLLARAMNAFLARLEDPNQARTTKIGIEALIEQPESAQLEFKSTLRWDRQLARTNKDLEQAVVKTVAAFLNSDGGCLVIGVSDDKQVVGLQEDFMSSTGIKDRDGFERHLHSIVRQAVGDATLSFMTVTFHSFEGRDVCQVTVESSDHAVFVPQNGGQAFFVRQGNATRSLDPKQTHAYAAKHWND